MQMSSRFIMPFKSQPPQTGPNDPIYWSKYDKLTDSPSMGDYRIPALGPPSGEPEKKAPKSSKPVGRQIGTKKKGSRSKRDYIRIEKDVKKYPGKHTREYIWNSYNDVIRVPPPSQLQQTVPTLDYRQLKTGVFHTFTDFPLVEPVTDQRQSTPAEILRNFPVVGKQRFLHTFLF